MNEVYSLGCEVRRLCETEVKYCASEDCGIEFKAEEAASEGFKKRLNITVSNRSMMEFEGVIHIKMALKCEEPKFFMPGYMYNRNAADMPSSGRKHFPRIRACADRMPESEFFMTRSDRLAEPVSLIYDGGRVIGLSAAPYIGDGKIKFCGFTCNINDNGKAGVGYTLGYENAPWLFVQSFDVREREQITEKNSFRLAAGSSYSFEMIVYDYTGDDERAIYRAIEDTYFRYHEKPRQIEGMDNEKALKLLSGAIRDHAWIAEDKMYTGFVYDKPEGFRYNKIPSISWTNGMQVAVPMLMTANRFGDDKAREQSITYIDNMIGTTYNPASGFMYDSTEDGKPSVRGWWYSGMHSGGHSSYLNGQAVYYLLKAYRDEKDTRGVVHDEWLAFSGKIVSKMNEIMNTDYEYPFAMSEKTGAGIEYDSLGSSWFLAASALYELISGDRTFMQQMLKSEEHYFEAFVKKVECYGGPLDTDKAVDDEGILAYIRSARILHEITGNEELLDHLRDALGYEFSYKLGYNTPVQVPPLSTIGWSSCGGSITSTANPHIHPMSSTVVDDIRYFVSQREDAYVRSRLEDTIGWNLQTFNTRDGEYGYGKPGWMSERFCFCEGLLAEKYPNGEPASTWFALMPWASSCVIEGLL